MPQESAAPSAERGLLLSLLLWVAVYVGLSMATLSLPNHVWGRIDLGTLSFSVLQLVAAVALIGTTLWLIHNGAACTWPRPALVAGAVICLVINQALHVLADPETGESVSTIALFGVANVALLGTALFIGKLVGSWIEQATWILPICLVLICVDIWSVYFGPTGELAEEVLADPAQAETGQRFLVWYPNLSPTEDQELIVTPSFGIGDFIVAALLLEAGRRFGLAPLRGLWAMAVALFVSLLIPSIISIFRPSFPGVPALPFLLGGFLAVHWPRLQINRREIVLCLVFVGVLLALLILLFNPLLSGVRTQP